MNIEAYNTERNNLSLEDTHDLLAIAEVLRNNHFTDAIHDLDDFIARRGYDENPPKRVYEIVFHADEDWQKEFFTWLEYKDLDADPNEVCRVVSVDVIDVKESN